MSAYPIRERRRKATLRFYWKVAIVSAVIAGIAWAAWLAPWARVHHTAAIEFSR
jgi:hypothetical protein